MTLNDSIRYVDDTLYCDGVPLSEVIARVGTPVYVYSLPRILSNLARIQDGFAELAPHIHYSAKANANLTVLKTVIDAGVGIDVVSKGEFYRALVAGAKGENIVFAGVGKRADEIKFALEKEVGWFNVENVPELQIINDLAESLGIGNVRVALRLNPEITANTHPYIATGHGAAKFGLTADVIYDVLQRQADYPNINFAGLHVHIGSQLRDVTATVHAVNAATALMQPHDNLQTLNIGGGLPVRYKHDDEIPDYAAFAAVLKPHLADYQVILEPGRSVVADVGVLLTELLYVKAQAGQTFYIVDASMTELMRPALYQAHHEIVPVSVNHGEIQSVQVVGPVCETTDVLGWDVMLPTVEAGTYIALLTVGAYGMVMANTYNARPRPAEVAVHVDGQSWSIIRDRETFEDLFASEIDALNG